MPKLKLTCLGGAGSIGASCFLLEAGKQAVVVDCGVRFDPASPLPDLDKLTGKRLEAILLTHAHSDHSGGLPVIHSAFPGVPIWMTPPTFDLIKILQKDALKLMELGLQKEGEMPLYQEAQVESMLERVELVHHWEQHALGQWNITYLPASHILGASMIHIATPQGRILFTGDFSVTAQKTVPALDQPQLPVDILVSEATYGNRLHADRRASETALVASIREVVMNSGRVLIPCFAIGRAQEVLMILKSAMSRHRLPQVPVFVDGMVRYACNIYTSHDRYASRAVQTAGRHGHVFYDRNISAVSSPKERNRVLQTSPCIIVASSGMLSGGPSVFYASQMASIIRDAIFITGYQDEESPGAALLNLAQNPEANKTLKLNDQSVEVACRFAAYSLSAHADKMQISGLVSALHPRTVVLVHGDKEAKQTLKEVLPCDDVEIGWDGLTVERAYGKVAVASAPMPEPQILPENLADWLRKIITEEPGPFSVTPLAEAFLGHAPSPEELIHFTVQMEATGLLKRDDARRWQCKRVKPAVAGAAAVQPQAIQVLKQENPKGKLNELCLRERLPYPEILLTKQENGRYTCILELTIAQQTFKTARRAGESKILAEQMAAQELLAMLAPHFASTKEAGTVPTSATPQSYPLEDAGMPPTVMERLAKQQEEISRHENKGAAEANAKPALHHYRQVGILQTLEFQMHGVEGPSHQPVFTMEAHATLKDGQPVSGGQVQGDTKKKAEMLAATKLLAALQENPVFVREIQALKQTQPSPPQTPPASQKFSPNICQQADDMIAEMVALLRAQDRGHDAGLPFFYYKRLAKQVIACNKVDDSQWIADRLEELHEQWENKKREIAEKEGYYPFVQFTRDVYDSLAETYGMWTLELMRDHLDDTRRIFPKWAAQFAGALKQIGREECLRHSDHLYQFVIGQNAWQESAGERDKLDELLTSARLKRLRSRLSGPPDGSQL
jgi:Cft2 family RNA processing exonuclease/dsRNA-specific ribonuclease